MRPRVKEHRGGGNLNNSDGGNGDVSAAAATDDDDDDVNGDYASWLKQQISSPAGQQ